MSAPPKVLRHTEFPPLDLRNIDLLPWQARAARQALGGTVKGVAWAGGYGSGKSFLCCYIAAMLCHLRPGAVVVLAMGSFVSLSDIHLPMLMEMMPGVGGGATYSPQTKTFSCANGSKLRLRHLDTPGDPNMGKAPVEGSSVHAFIVDEAQQVHQGYYRFARARSRARVGTWPALRIFSGLPIGTWWCTHAAADSWPVHRPRTRANLANLDEGYEADLRAGMSQADADAYLDGKELIQQGGVFREYVAASESAGGHWTDWEPTDRKGTRFVLVADLGIRWPHAGLFAEDLGGNRWVCLAEWAPDNATIADLSRAMARQCVPRAQWPQGDARWPVDQFIIDPAGGEQRLPNGQPQAQLWGMPPPDGFGMYPTWERDAGRRGIVDGCMRVNFALHKRALMFSRRMMEAGMQAPPKVRTLARCMTGYRWDPKNPDSPDKDNFHDHGADMTRYFVRALLWSLKDAAAMARPRADTPAPPPPDALRVAKDAC